MLNIAAHFAFNYLMPTSSPVAAIYHVIQQVRASATANAGLFQNNEAATRAALIDPILRALGWDTANVRLVEPERMVANKQKLDYLLKDSQGAVRSVIEAKKLGESLDKLGHVGALIGYAFSLKPTSFFITDGLNWHYYSPAHSSYEPIAELNLQEANSIEAALQLIQWLDAAHAGHGLTLPWPNGAPALEPPAAASWPPNGKPTAKASAKPKHPRRPGHTADFIELQALDLLSLPPGQKPKRLRLPNGTVKPINTWKDILLEVCRLALATNPNIPLPLPDKAGKKRFLFASEKPIMGSSTAATYRDKPLFIGTHYSAADCIANALHAAKQIPMNHSSTAIAVRF